MKNHLLNIVRRSETSEVQTTGFVSVKRAMLFLFVLLAHYAMSSGQEQISISGRIIDSSNGTALTGASILDDGSGKGTTSDDSGRYRLLIDGDSEHRIIISYLGFEQIDTLIQTRQSAVRRRGNRLGG